ncbi:MAG TPA: type II toxin-antitoxin system HicB family antitoxin [Armatimonadota bacterium]
MQDSYIFPAIFTYNDDAITVEFPDLPGCVTFGDTAEEAFAMAQDALEGYLSILEEDHEEIPAPAPVNELHPTSNQAIVLIRANMLLTRQERESQAVKTTVTMPKWLKQLADQQHVNFSQVLQAALKKVLGLSKSA